MSENNLKNLISTKKAAKKKAANIEAAKKKAQVALKKNYGIAVNITNFNDNGKLQVTNNITNKMRQAVKNIHGVTGNEIYKYAGNTPTIPISNMNYGKLAEIYEIAKTEVTKKRGLLTNKFKTIKALRESQAKKATKQAEAEESKAQRARNRLLIAQKARKNKSTTSQKQITNSPKSRKNKSTTSQKRPIYKECI